MLEHLIKFGEDEGYFEIKRIGDFKKAKDEGYGHINIVAIDFDSATDKFCREKGLDNVKSCDVLHIIYLRNRINFVEFKLFTNTSDEKIQEKIDVLPQKVKDSRDTLVNIIKLRKFCHGDKYKYYLSCEKNVVISFDLVNGPKRFGILMLYSKIEQIIIKQLIDNKINGENFKDPICMRINNFEGEYSRRFL